MGTGSKIDVQTVLKLMAEAITATYASSGASSGSGTSSTWIEVRGSFSSDAHAGEHLLFVGTDERGPRRLGQREAREVLGGGAFENGGADGIDLGHGANATGRCEPPSTPGTARSHARLWADGGVPVHWPGPERRLLPPRQPLRRIQCPAPSSSHRPAPRSASSPAHSPA